MFEGLAVIGVALMGVEVLGRDLPSSSFVIALILLGILFLVFNRNGGLQETAGGGAGKTGRGRVFQCTRCGRNFQPEQVELLAGGNTRVTYDDRCPGCGWDLEWGDADKKRPGGASGGW